jgi:hypothetical protein
MQTEKLFIWRFTPVARPDDPAWQGRAIWSELRVAAATPGAAMIAADRHYQAAQGLSSELSQDRQQVRPGFEDIKLYRLDRLDELDAPPSDNPVLFERRAGGT